MLVLVLVRHFIQGFDFYSYLMSFIVSIFFTLVLAIDMFFGMLAGAGIFLLITLVGGLIAGKEAMGFGDVKLIFITSFCFGLVKSYIALILACLFGIVFIVVKNKISQEKINKVPFAPFISSGYFLVQLFYGLVK